MRIPNVAPNEEFQMLDPSSIWNYEILRIHKAKSVFSSDLKILVLASNKAFEMPKSKMSRHVVNIQQAQFLIINASNQTGLEIYCKLQD